MKKQILIPIFSFFITFFFLSCANAETVRVEIFHSVNQYHSGNQYPIGFRLIISDDLYIHGPETGDVYLIPTTLSFENTASLRIKDLIFPEPRNIQFEYAKDLSEVYKGSVDIKASLFIGTDIGPGEYEIKARLSYQACSDISCLPPEQRFFIVPIKIVSEDIPLNEINKSSFSSQQIRTLPIDKDTGIRFNTGILLTLLSFFLAGLGLNLTPCIYPLIPITVSYFGGKGEGIRGNTLIHAGFFLTGIAITNSLLGVFAALSGNLLGSLLQHQAVLIIISCILLFLGLNLFGLWDLKVPSRLSEFAATNYIGYSGTLFMGLTLGIVAAPCAGPFLLGLLAYVARTGDPILGFLYFFILSIGMGLPLSLLAIFSGAIDRLPMSGEWLIWVRKMMGWILMGMAAYMISPVFYAFEIRPWLIFGVSVLAGIHLGWLTRSGKNLKGFSIFKKILGTLILCMGFVYLCSSTLEKEGIHWMGYNEQLIREAAGNKKPVMLDFYADWCAPCRKMEKTLFKDPEIRELSRNFVNLRVDLTTKETFYEELLNHYGIAGVPTVIFLNEEGMEERELRVEGLVKSSAFTSRMKKALEDKSVNEPVLQQDKY